MTLNCCYFLFSLLLGHLSGLLSAQPPQRLCLAGLCPWLFLPHALLLGDFPHTTFYLKSTSLLWSSRPVFPLLEFSTHRYLTCKYSKSSSSPSNPCLSTISVSINVPQSTPSSSLVWKHFLSPHFWPGTQPALFCSHCPGTELGHFSLELLQRSLICTSDSGLFFLWSILYHAARKIFLRKKKSSNNVIPALHSHDLKAFCLTSRYNLNSLCWLANTSLTSLFSVSSVCPSTCALCSAHLYSCSFNSCSVNVLYWLWSVSPPLPGRVFWDCHLSGAPPASEWLKGNLGLVLLTLVLPEVLKKEKISMWTKI